MLNGKSNKFTFKEDSFLYDKEKFQMKKILSKSQKV